MEPPFVTDFLAKAPTLDANWRAVVLFGRNVASYKLARNRGKSPGSHGDLQGFVNLTSLFRTRGN